MKNVEKGDLVTWIVDYESMKKGTNYFDVGIILDPISNEDSPIEKSCLVYWVTDSRSTYSWTPIKSLIIVS